MVFIKIPLLFLRLQLWVFSAKLCKPLATFLYVHIQYFALR